MNIPLIHRPVQEICASFPSHIAIDGGPLAIDGFFYVQPGAKGYWPLHPSISSLEAADALLARTFGARQPTEAEREAASIGSMFGWDVPGADPLNHMEREA